MNASLLALIAICLYLLGSGFKAIQIIRKSAPRNIIPITSGLVAAIAQASSIVISFGQHQSFDLVHSTAIITCISVVVFIIFATRKPIHNMLLIMYPAAALSMISMLAIRPDDAPNQLDNGILVHIALSILAYSILCLASVQAIFVVYRNRQLKSHLHSNSSLPPLLVMESTLFDLLRIGTLFLAIAITLGFIFVHDLFAQHLAHKTFFSLVSLVLFGVLLFGRRQYGWRGSLAASLTLWGTGSLMLGFFGTKIVLESIL
ncbi:hypothetical protein A3715_18505 [Oleiphilus sp. HI0009]|nr:MULTISPECIES: cytochrome c biogenesis protein CcsA [unclassified Oleiphilus]KZX78020.1 hypothetical protein A3715_10840 [Oleiphilus sp. HI0009]MCH2159321.1 cytochrome c biogenesis protein CcsA [Oleiphilaceae bacterium]KZX82891.1 hypothetical protein A3715_18505 [Oleiphilus sp. HI0009]KZY66173.1 hypothetical protein A3738_07370 [Oleiphilus sp. HI0066]KZY68621.1 hypothetical protein A3739_10840 [Oleiphilus sp. HI0067]